MPPAVTPVPKQHYMDLLIILLALFMGCSSQQQGGSCPYPHTHVASSGGCQCDPGYQVNAAGTACEAGGTGLRCPLHAHVVDGGTSCECDAGYAPDVVGTQCVTGNPSASSGCPPHAHAARSGGCECDVDSHVNDEGTACVEGAPTDATCPANAHVAPDGICDCDDGFVANSAGDACEEPCEGTVMSPLAADDPLWLAAPQTVRVGGLSCHYAGNTDYSLQDQLVNGRPYWSAGGGYNLYWGRLQGAEPGWLLDSQGTIDSCLITAEVPTIVAIVESDDMFPPQDGDWRDRCSGLWRDSPMTSTYVLSASNCAALASQALVSATTSVCADSVRTGCLTDEVTTCSLPCAELWLRNQARCAAHTSAFDRSRLDAPCEQRARASLATAPSSVVVAPSTTGGNCYASAYGSYELQPVPRSGKPYYTTPDGGWHLYWASGSVHRSVATWIIDSDEDTGFTALYLSSHSSSPPTGTWNWQQTCDGELAPIAVSITAQFSKSWCADALIALAPELTAVCCVDSNDPGCGVAGAVPTHCSEDCAALWAPYSDQCELTAEDIGTELASFFNGECTPAVETLRVLAPTTVDLMESETAELRIRCTSGIRYEITAHSGPGDGLSRPCTLNEYDDPTFSRGNSGPGECDRQISSGRWGCAKDLAEGTFARYCDLSCGFECVQLGIEGLNVWVLPPGATGTQHVASSLVLLPDKSVQFSAADTGEYTVRFRAGTGAGPVTIQANAVGSAEQRSPQLITDGHENPLSVQCYLLRCTYTYSGADVIDGDGHGFDLRMTAQAGVAYAVSVNLPEGQTAVDIDARFYYAGAAAGSAGFQPTLKGSMGTWTATAPGSHDYTEYTNCEVDDPSCEYLTVGVHPGESFPTQLHDTWVAPSSGAVLLHLRVNCDVPFFSDVNLPGCAIESQGVPAPVNISVKTAEVSAIRVS